MGYDADVYIVYGIPFDYKKMSTKKLAKFVKLVFPELYEDFKYEEEDLWSNLDSDPHKNGYYLLDFTNDKKIFICCFAHIHSVIDIGTLEKI